MKTPGSSLLLRDGEKRPPEEMVRILRRRIHGGKRFYGAFCPDVDMQLDEFFYSRYFTDNRVGICLECGALDGVTTSNSLFFEKSLGWECHNIEPSPQSFEALAHNRRNSHNYNIALSDRDGKLDFSLSRLAGLNSIVVPGGNGSDTLEIIRVEALMYKTFIKRAGLEKVDLFILDVEGHELQVINGMHGTDVLPLVFCVECWDESRFIEVKARLQTIGYSFDAAANNNYIFCHDAAANNNT